MDSRRKELGEFLQVMRGRHAPEEFGFPAGSRRRAQGLRREEVAQLAGISPTWYTWIEQGRAVNVSAEALNRLAQTLRLTRGERAYIFAGILGVMQWQLAHVVASARERSVGKGRLADLQAIAHRMADMKLRLDTVELWVARCAALSDAGQRLTLASAQTKLLVSEAFLQSSLDAVQIMGARGLESGMSTLVEDAKRDGTWDAADRPELPEEPPPALAAALRRSAKARATFEKLAPSHRRQYIAWIATAKREDTIQRRVAKSIALLEQGEKLGMV